MKIVLLERVAKLGQMGEIVTVKDGYARNYLLPQKKALWASEANLRTFEARKAQLEALNLESKKEAEAIAERLNGQQFMVIRQASDGGNLYGSVTTRDTAEAATEAGFTVERRQIQITTPIKELGIHKVAVRLHPEVDAEIELNVARSVEEARLQAQGVNIAEQAAEEEALAEIEIAELFDEIGAAELDELERGQVIAKAIFEEETEPNIPDAIEFDERKIDQHTRSQNNFPSRLNDLQTFIKSGISNQWGDSAVVLICHKIIDHLDSFADEAEAPFSYKKIEMLVDADSKKQHLLVALNILTTSEFSVFRTVGIFFDEEDNECQLDSNEFRSVLSRNQLMHPRTGEVVEDPESRVEPFFLLKNPVLEIAIGSLVGDGVPRSSNEMKGR